MSVLRVNINDDNDHKESKAKQSCNKTSLTIPLRLS